MPKPTDLLAALPSEDIVLGAMLDSTDYTARALSDGLTAAAFDDPNNQHAADLHAQLFLRLGTASVETLVSEMVERASMKDGEAQRLYDLALQPVGNALFVDHLDRLLSASRLRKLFGSVDGLKRRITAPGGGSMRERLGIARDGVGHLLRIVSEGERTSYAGSELAAIALEPDRYVLTGLNRLDDVITGYPAGRVTLVAARPSHGKSSTAIELVCRHIDQIRRGAINGQAVYFSCEMSASRLAKRIAQGRGLPYLNDVPLTVDDVARPTTEHMIGRCLSLHGATPVTMVVFDYLQYTGEKGQGRRERLDAALHGCHELAKRLDCPVLVLAQLNRDADQHAEPQLSDIKETGAAEEVAATVLMPYWPWMHWFQNGRKGPEPLKKDYAVFARKNTFGDVGTTPLVFDTSRGRILDHLDERDPFAHIGGDGAAVDPVF